MIWHRPLPAFLAFSLLLPIPPVRGGTLTGYVRDQNWFAQYQSNPAGVGYYEYAVNANSSHHSSLGGAAATDIFGAFQMNNLPAGAYTVASWDVWWRSAYAFNVPVPSSGSAPAVDLRLRATMWGYPAFWDDTGYYEFGQTFVASGPVSMIYLRAPHATSYTLTIHEGGPGGARLGRSRSFSGAGDHRMIYGYGDMPTVAGQTYYARIRTGAPTAGGVLMQMDPRPDYSDPMPGGCLWLGDGTTLTPHPDRDLGLVIMSDDDGLLTNLYARQGGGSWSGVTSVGQTFVARGVNLISVALWLADGSAPVYVVRVLRDGPGGVQVGTTKRGKPPRLGADPEMIVTWAPGECPLVPGQTYFVEVTRDGGGAFSSVYVNVYDPYPYGDAYRNGASVSGTDLAGTIMEEQSTGSATRPTVRITGDPTVSESNRGTNRLTIRWTTDVPSDSAVEFAVDHPPYTATNSDPTLVTDHEMTLSNLPAHALHHFRVVSARTGHRPAISRDFAICTRPVGANLLVNPGFESGTGSSPRSSFPGWTGAGLDIKTADGTWFGGLSPHTGAWLLQGAVNAGTADGYVYQRVTGVQPDRDYTFSAWIMTAMRENNTWKYDVWNDRGRLSYVRLGLDPTGGTDIHAATVQWTPRFYSHRHYTQVAKTVAAQGSNLTVFVEMKGSGGQWHLYGVDDCVLAERAPAVAQPFETAVPWDSSFDLPPENAADFAIVAHGQDGNALQIARDDAGSSVRVLVLPLQPNAMQTVSILGRCPGFTDAFSAECAFKLGRHTAQDFSEDAGSWTRLVKFSNPGRNGNGNVWTNYARIFAADTNVWLSVAFALSSTGANGTAAQWDTLRLEPARPVPLPLVAIDAGTVWKYDQSGANLGTAWRSPDFDDSRWASGPALLADESAPLPEPIRTPLSVGANKITFYFRHRFVVPSGVVNPALRLRQVVDDGAVYYLNGAEVFRLGVTNDPVAFNHPASRVVSEAVYEGPFDVTVTNLLPGTNVLAVEVHQQGAGSSDVVFGATLEALVYSELFPTTNATLRIENAGGYVALDWDAYTMVLETASDVNGPWSAFAEQASPVILPSADSTRFFRLRQ